MTTPALYPIQIPRCRSSIMHSAASAHKPPQKKNRHNPPHQTKENTITKKSPKGKTKKKKQKKKSTKLRRIATHHSRSREAHEEANEQHKCPTSQRLSASASPLLADTKPLRTVGVPSLSSATLTHQQPHPRLRPSTDGGRRTRSPLSQDQCNQRR